MPFHLSLRTAVALVVFMVVSILVGAAMAGAGGWRALAERYPPPRATSLPEERYRFTSVRTAGGLLGTATYKNCVTVGVSTGGISLALWGPFSLFHPPVFVPWIAVESCRTIEVYGAHATQLTVEHGESLTVYGQAAAAIARSSAQRGFAGGAA
jgi:hypothetical protein